MKRIILFLLAAALAFSLCPAAFAGCNPLTVATEGRGIAVYTSSSGGKQAGIIYNGYDSDLSLEPKKGLYSCNLTVEYTVWLNQDKAEKALPKGWNAGSVNDASLESQMPCDIFLAEVAQQDAPLYSTPGHKRLGARHARGTLALVCGEFGDDYYVVTGGFESSGFMPKSALQKVKALSYSQAGRDTWGIDRVLTRTVYTGGGILMRSASATGYSDGLCYWQVNDGDQVTVLAMVGEMAQLAGGGFIEARFLDPQADHARTYATVTSDQPLNRLNVRNYASKDASVSCKLCPGAQVQVVNHTDDWASVFITGEAGSNLYAGVVQMQYLAFAPQQVVNGCTRVRTKYPLHAGNDGRSYRASWSGGETLPVGTMLTVVGVEGHFNIDDDYPDRFLCLTGDGRLVTIFEDGVLEPVETLGISAKASSSVRMREAPGKTAVVIRTLSKGDRVEVLLRGEGWTQVQYKGETGYVMSRYLQFP